MVTSFWFRFRASGALDAASAFYYFEFNWTAVSPTPMAFNRSLLRSTLERFSFSPKKKTKNFPQARFKTDVCKEQNWTFDFWRSLKCLQPPTLSPRGLNRKLVLLWRNIVWNFIMLFQEQRKQACFKQKRLRQLQHQHKRTNLLVGSQQSRRHRVLFEILL